MVVGSPTLDGWLALVLGIIALGVVCALKGKYVTAALGILVPVWLWPIGAIRLAKPDSLWARQLYGPAKLARASERHARRES